MKILHKDTRHPIETNHTQVKALLEAPFTLKEKVFQLRKAFSRGKLFLNLRNIVGPHYISKRELLL